MDPKKRCDDINELHPKVKELAQKLIAEAKKQGMNVKVIDTYRSKERQDWLYAQGRTRPGNVVTNATGKDMTSYHNWRLAFDCVQNIPGKEYDSSFLQRLGKIGQKLGIEWGGGWSSFNDAPHFQYTFGLSIKDLKAGKKPPIYNPIDQQYKNAVDKLGIEGIIGQPCSWHPKLNLSNVDALVKKMGNRLFGAHGYVESVNALIANGVISSPDIWIKKTYTEDNVKSLIIKVASKV